MRSDRFEDGGCYRFSGLQHPDAGDTDTRHVYASFGIRRNMALSPAPPAASAHSARLQHPALLLVRVPAVTLLTLTGRDTTFNPQCARVAG